VISKEQLGTGILCALLLAVGGLSWWLALKPALRADGSRLLELPQQIESWSGHKIPLETTVEAELRADTNVQRAYVHPSGGVVWLYIGYYGTARGGRPEHTPRGCYTGAGWSIEEARVLSIGPGSALRVNEYRVERDGEQHLVHFWYRSHRRTGILGGLDQNVDRLLGRLLDGRADGALIRISTPLPRGGDGDEIAARSRLFAFATQLDPLVGKLWPVEHRAE